MAGAIPGGVPGAMPPPPGADAPPMPTLQDAGPGMPGAMPPPGAQPPRRPANTIALHANNGLNNANPVRIQPRSTCKTQAKHAAATTPANPAAPTHGTSKLNPSMAQPKRTSVE